MDSQNDPKYDFKAPEDNIRKWKPKSYENNAFQGVSPFDFAMRQKNEEKKRKEREREAKAKMYSYKSKGVSTLAEENAKALNQAETARKNEARNLIEEAKHVNMAAAGFGVEQASRTADFQRDQAYKEGKRNQIEANKDVNMCPLKPHIPWDQIAWQNTTLGDAQHCLHSAHSVENLTPRRVFRLRNHGFSQRCTRRRGFAVLLLHQRENQRRRQRRGFAMGSGAIVVGDTDGFSVGVEEGSELGGSVGVG